MSFSPVCVVSNARIGRFARIVLLGLLTAGGTLAAVAQDRSQSALAIPSPQPSGKPTELVMRRAGSSAVDLRRLPATPPPQREETEREEPEITPIALPGGLPELAASLPIGPKAAAPAPAANFLGLDFLNWGAGRPPDTVGDVGPVYYIQAVNTSIGVFRKSDSVRVAAFTFNTLMSQGSFGNLCDTNNFGDPVVLYDTFEDRWVITDFAFQVDGGGNVVSPPGAYQCFAVSKTGDPVTGGWNYYSIHIADVLADYPKFGIWPDGLYMSANTFGFPANAAFQGTRVWAFNKAQMYAGAPAVQIVQFSPPSAEFTLLPANARLQAGTPPPGSPNYYTVVWQFTNAVSVYKFHVDWNSLSLSTFTGPFIAIAPASWAAAPANVPAQGGNNNDTLATRLMMQSQYSNLGGVESLWSTHTVLGGAAATAAPRFYQVTVTGGTVAANTTQAATHTPDTTVNRYMPSLAVDRAGDMALGYSASSATLMAAIRYAGRLATDPLNTLPQTETSLIAGTGAQNTTTRWGDYSAMSLDPNGCTFWYTNEYYAAVGNNWQTRVGSFQFPSCTPVATGTLQGTVTATVGGAPISSATLTLGSRTATTDGAGFYQFTNLPSGTYPTLTASAPGYLPSTVSGIVITDGATTTQNFSLATAPASGCLTDTTQADFQTGVPTNVDLTTSPGDVILLNAPTLDQSNTAGTTTGTSFGTTSWGGQTFIPAVTGQLSKADVQLFCSGCTGTTPNLTLSIRATSGGLPIGADLATATIPGFSNGASVYYTASFGSPATLTAGTQYALILRPVAAPSAGGYFWIRSSPSTYANGQRVISTDNGATWTADSTRDFNFRTYMQTGFAAAGDLISSLKDANPAVGLVAVWQTLSWNATVPGGTNLQFQAAASNSATGPFNFVGPDGTAATFFTTSGASLSQFNGKRYLEYRAYLTTSSGAVTPTLNDVTVCFTTVPLPDLAITKTDGVATAVPGGSVTYTITATNTSASLAGGGTVADTFPATLTCTWTCTGAGGGTCTASGSGNLNDTVNLPASASVTYTAACAIAASATGTLSNTATVAGAGDPNSANDSATDTDTLTPQADLAITKTDGVTTATPGGSVTYTITASNAGPSNATGATVADTFPASLTCTWTCVGAGGGTCTASGSGNINNTVNLPSGGSVTYTASCNVSAAATGTLSNTATVTAPAGVTDPTPGNNSATDSDTLGASADLAITKTDGVTTATPGGSVTYTITASNAGPSNATGATVADTFPASLTCTWTCVGAGGGTCTASGSGNINGSVNLPSGGSVTYTASCTISAAATGTLSNTATITAPAGVTDPTPGNNSATDSDGLGATADLAITKTDGVTTAAPGGSVTYTITASNAGPSNAPGATVADTFPASLTCTWTCVGAGGGTCTAAGSGNINNTVNLPSGGSVTYTASCTLSAAATGTLSNTATITAPAGVTDPTPGNNSATDSDTLTASANLGITKTDGVTTATPGGSVTYTITASNAGPSNATGATVADTFPASLTCTWTCVGAGGGTCTAAGSGNINNTVNLPSGGSVTYTASCNISAAATGTLSNTATITAPAGVTDPVPGNNSATDSDTLGASADLAITKTDGVTTATPGGSVTYTITASSAGPSNATGATVADTFPASLTCTWTCVGAGGGTCTASGSGNINGTVNLPSGGSVTYTASCNISAAATGTLSNTATITAPAGVTDPTPGNNSATDSDTLGASADLAITKTDGVTTATPGGSVTYTITASNAGPSNATGATVADTFPASLTCTWTCVGAGGGTCTASGSGNINGTVNLPSGASVTYTASCNISAAATGTLTNTATVTAPAGVTDPTPGNNSATDSDTLGASADLAITKTDGVTSATPGGSVTYTITASNAGPSDATGATVADTFPASLTCTWTCTGTGGGTCTASGSGNLNDTVNLPNGGSVTYTASCNISAAATGTLTNTATVTAPAGVTDPTPGNNSATDSDTLGASADLAITKTDGVTTATAGGSVTYTITASNAGPSDATGATVADTFPATLTCTWTCAGAAGGTCAASGSGNINNTVNLPSGGSVTYTASCTLSAAATGTLSNTATVTAPAGVTDPTPGNNSATDSDTVTAAPGANVSGTKTAAGTFAVGGTITYTITLTNSGTGAQGDNPGNELTDVLPSTLTLVSATATSGAAVATVGTNTVTWNGAIPAAGTVTITITATVKPSAAGTTVSNQGTISYDSDGNGTNDATRQTDDPTAAGAADPTSVQIAGGPAPAPIPTLSVAGLLLLGLALGGLAFAILRRRRSA